MTDAAEFVPCPGPNAGQLALRQLDIDFLAYERRHGQLPSEVLVPPHVLRAICVALELTYVHGDDVKYMGVTLFSAYDRRQAARG